MLNHTSSLWITLCIYSFFEKKYNVSNRKVNGKYWKKSVKGWEKSNNKWCE